LRVVIAGGGTGGHLFPGIAVARELLARRPETLISFAGTAQGIEARVLPREGFALDLIRSGGIKGKSIVGRARGAALLPASAWEDPEFRPYVSSRYQVCYMFMEQGGSLGRLQVLGLLPARAEDLLLTADTTQSFPNGFRDSLPFWCSAVSTEEARELVGILEDAGAFMQYPANPSYSFSQVFIDFGPLLPHETPKA